MSKKLFRKFSLDENAEGPIESGQTLGMLPRDVLEKYLDRPNSLLTLLRIYGRRSLADVSKALGISESELEKIERSDDLVPYQLLPRLAKIFGIELKPLLILLGHAKNPSEDRRVEDSYQFALAAQYSGPELSEQEKIDLEKLFKMILERIENRKKENII